VRRFDGARLNLSVGLDELSRRLHREGSHPEYPTGTVGFLTGATLVLGITDMLADSARAGVRIRVASDGPASDLADALSTEGSRIAAVGSTGIAAIEPLAVLTGDGRSAFLFDCPRDRLEDVASATDGGLDGVADLADAVVDHDPETGTLPLPDRSALGVGERRVLGPCGWLRPTSTGDYAAAGGFASADVERIDAVADALAGRGWGDWSQDVPIGEAWDRARSAEGDVTVVINGHGNQTDALLCASAPLAVLDGAQSAARALGAGEVVIYLGEGAEHARATIEAAAAGYPDPHAATAVVTGPDVYRAAEPTMAIEAIEGSERLEARLRPPGPDEVGLEGDPTLVHTPRTLAHLATALRRGEPAGTRLVTVTGDVAAPATVELSTDAPLARALDAVDPVDGVKAACVGGRFGGITTSLDVSPAPAALVDAGLGTGGSVHVLDEGRCVLRFVGERARFAADANCGRCVPCREGTTQLAAALREVYEDAYEPDRLDELGRVVATSSICTFGVDAARPTRTAIREFDDEFVAHAEGRCPTGSCQGRTEGGRA